jgi:hypothetical protein
MRAEAATRAERRSFIGVQGLRRAMRDALRLVSRVLNAEPPRGFS